MSDSNSGLLATPKIFVAAGTHVSNTAEVGAFKVISESGIASGVRRIEAVAGAAAVEHLSALDSIVRATALTLKVRRLPSSSFFLISSGHPVWKTTWPWHSSSQLAIYQVFVYRMLSDILRCVVWCLNKMHEISEECAGA
jgi:hypothetical protein